MRCPKCGAFVEDGRKICFMCGENIDPNQQNNFNVNNPADTGNDIIQSTLNESLNSTITGASMASPSMGGFNSPDMNGQNQNTGFGTGAFGGFSNGGNQLQSPMNTVAPPPPKKDKNYKPKPHEEQDIFDFYEKNKFLVKSFFFLLIIALAVFVGYKMYTKALEPEEKEAKIHELYFEISEDFIQTKDEKTKLTFAKSGSKGTDCLVEIFLGTGSSENHPQEFQDQALAAITPERDEEGKPADPLKEFTTQTNSLTINNHQWHYMNVFYRKNTSSTEYTVLKYQLMTAIKNGYFYDIALTNNSSTSSCSTSLDNFIKSLEFVEPKK